MILSPVTLTGRHVRLEPISEAHFDALARHGADLDVWRWMPSLRPDPRESVRVWCDTVMPMQARGEMAAFAIIDLARGEAVGGTTLFDYSEAHKRVEIGYTWLAKPAWRTPINTECKYLLLRHAFEVLGLNRVQLKTDARNERSQAAIARLGAVREGLLRAHMVMPDGWVRDSVMFSIVAAEWPGVKAGLAAKMAR
ncbi:MAG: GNAT family N-acetyltransferase [Verrucomicrobia bacterium]|nr:GNAT family N-acetyltransferase [Verrucomicrobiota bacterium]